MPKQKFFDLKKRKSFTTDKFETETKIIKGKAGKRKITFAVTKVNGRKVTTIIKNEKA